MNAKLLLALLPAVCLCGPAHSSYAQLNPNGAVTPVATGRIAGVVKDPSGAVVPGAEVEGRNLTTGVRKSIVTNLTGRFVLDGLPDGFYEVTAAFNGFEIAILHHLVVAAGAETDVTLESPDRVLELEEWGALFDRTPD
ncbi:MAG: carboxypeptidase regulatory-like domain-containing protein, partial [Terracidiphilus sp.]